MRDLDFDLALHAFARVAQERDARFVFVAVRQVQRKVPTGFQAQAIEQLCRGRRFFCALVFARGWNMGLLLEDLNALGFLGRLVALPL